MTVSLLGVPYDEHSSFLRGAAFAPAALRRALASESANWAAESGLDLHPRFSLWTDRGDIELAGEVVEVCDAIKSAIHALVANGERVLSIGGDHLISWPVISAFTETYEELTVLHFDAHPDLYDELDGDRYSHACPFARLMEEGNVARLIQVGIRTATPHQRQQAERFGVEMLELAGWDYVIPPLSGPVYITVDVDALDPAFVPGTSHHEPGGLSTRQLLDLLHQVRRQGVDVVGADIVEINPTRDTDDMTAMVGAKLARELLALLLAGNN